MTPKSRIRVGLAVGLAALACLAGPVLAQNLPGIAAAIPQGTGPGMIDPTAPPGFLGIPGAPSINLILAFAWSVWVGWIFSSVGAFGGVMAAVGHISIFGLGAYAAGFPKTQLNKSITDSIRVSNQLLALLTGSITTFNYLRQRRIVVPLALALGAGSVIGSFLSTFLSASKISFSQYQGYFGAFVLLLGGYLFYETTPAGLARKAKSREAAKTFEETMKKLRCGESVDLKCLGVKVLTFSLKRVTFSFYGVEFHFRPFLPFIGGLFISAIAAFLGVGGGFMLVPFLTSVTNLPMHLAAGTSALAVVISMVTSISTFLAAGTSIDWALIGAEMIGVCVGSVIGPRTSRHIPDVWLKRLFILMSLYVGVDYILKGFFKIKLLG